MSNASSVITSMQSALNCASKCDCCDKLQQQINAINAKLAGLTKPDGGGDINALIAVAVGAALSQRLPGAVDSSVNARLSGLNLSQYATVNDLKASRAGIQSEIDAFRAKIEAGIATKAEKTAVEAYDRALSADIASAKRDAELAKGLANQAKNQSTEAIKEATSAGTKAATVAEDLLQTNADVGGLKGLVDGLKGEVSKFSAAIARLEASVGNAIAEAAKAIGISNEALAATGRLLGKIAEIFNIIGTFSALIEQLTTLNTLGGRIDAVEAGLEALGASVSDILGRLLGLQNRIGRNEASISEVRAIAIDAKGIGEAANLKAGAAIGAARTAQSTADTALGDAKQAQLTADGAVRNAATANDNATTAYKKATEAQGIGEQAKQIAGNALGKAGEALTTALTAIALYQSIKSLRGIQGIQGIQGIKGDRGDRGLPGLNGVTTVVTLPGAKGDKGDPGSNGRAGINGIPGKNGKDGKDVNPADLASLRALIVGQHAQTRASASSAIGGLKGFVSSGFASLTALTTAIGSSVIFATALNVLTFATTMHNALMLSNNLGQTLGTIIDQVLAFILPKGLDGTPINIGTVLGKAAHEIIADTIGEANYTTITEDWAKANRIYQASSNVFNQLSNMQGLLTAGMEVIGGNVAKVGNALKIWGVIGEKAYAFMNPQPNFKGKFFSFINGANDSANTIMAMVAIPIGIKAAADGINDSVAELQKNLNQQDPKDENKQPIHDPKTGDVLKYQPGITVPTATVTEQVAAQAKADSQNIITATIDDLIGAND